MIIYALCTKPISQQRMDNDIIYTTQIMSQQCVYLYFVL